MSPVDKGTVQEKLLKLESIVKILNDLKKSSREEFVKDDRINGATMFNIVIGVEVIVDIANHILSEVFDKPASTYKDSIIFLGDFGVLPKDFADTNKEMADFRNKLIHDYDRVTLDKVYDNLQKAPDIFRQFAKYFVEFLEKES